MVSSAKAYLRMKALLTYSLVWLHLQAGLSEGIRTTTSQPNHDSSATDIPSITFEALESVAAENADALDLGILMGPERKIGAFFIKNIPEYEEAFKEFQSRSPDCLKKHGLLSPMLDGSSRFTFATDSPKGIKEYPECLGKGANKLSQIYDKVESYISKIISKGAQKADGGNSLLMQDSNGKVHDLETAPTKDHLHLYLAPDHPLQFPSTLPMVPFHIDNGIFLIISNFPKHPLSIQTSGETIVSRLSGSLLKEDGLLVLMGLGLTEWLLQDRELAKKQFYPVPHSVPSLSETGVIQRVAFARMKVAGTSWIPFRSKDQKNIQDDGNLQIPVSNRSPRTFGELFQQEHYTTKAAEVAKVNPEGKGESNLLQMVSRSSSWQKVMKTNCNVGSAYCWMNCLPLPEDCPEVQEAYCYSQENNVPCFDDSMDTNCKWYCNKNTTANDQFCNGIGTDMYMDGFKMATLSEDAPCVILFFNSWKLDSPAKFGGACVGVVWMGIILEAAIFLRRILGRWRITVVQVAKVALFGANLGLAYLYMLVVMTYCGELFLCALLGLMLGHAFWNVRNTQVAETVDPCCSNSVSTSGKPNRVGHCSDTQKQTV